MQDAGYGGYRDQDDIVDELEERPGELAGDEDPAALSGPKAEELKQLEQDEIAISLADLRCQIDYLDSVIEEVEIDVFGVPVSG